MIYDSFKKNFTISFSRCECTFSAASTSTVPSTPSHPPPLHSYNNHSLLPAVTDWGMQQQTFASEILRGKDIGHCRVILLPAPFNNSLLHVTYFNFLKIDLVSNPTFSISTKSKMYTLVRTVHFTSLMQCVRENL